MILDTFGLVNDKIINVDKLDSFLSTLQSQYYKTTLYHNSMHGADVTQMVSLFFLNSNAENILKPQGLIYLNDTLIQGIDINHHEVLIENQISNYDYNNHYLVS